MNSKDIIRIVKTLVENEQLPIVEFKNGISIGDEIGKIAYGSDMIAGETIDQAAERWTVDFLNNVPELFGEHLNEIGLRIASNISNSSERFNELVTLVTDLTAKIDGKVDRIIELSPELRKIVGKENMEIEYSVADFSPLERMGNSAMVIDDIHDFMKISGSTGVRYSYEKVMELYLSMRLTGVIPEDIVLSDDEYEEIKGELITDLGCEVETARDAIKLCTVRSRVSGLLQKTRRLVEPSTNYTDQMFEAIETIDTYTEIVKSVQDKLLQRDFNPNAVSANIDTLYSCLTQLCYFAIYHRNNTFQNTILFKNECLNPDLLAVATDKQIGTREIARFVSIKLNDEIRSDRGVLLNTVEANIESVNSKFENAVNADTIFLETELRKLQEKYIVQVVGEYIASVDEADEDGIAYYAHRVMTTRTTVEDVVYEILIQKQFKGTTLDTLYQKMGAGMKLLAEQNIEITPEMLYKNNLDVNVDIATDVIAKLLLK